MARQQPLAESNRDGMVDGARFVVSEMLREPVKDAVKEALREETVAVRTDDEETPATDRAEASDRSETDDDGSGGSRIGLVLLSAAALGIAYAVRKRRSDSTQATWSEFDDEGVGESGRTDPEPGSAGTADTAAGASRSSAATSE
jgi:hypothetical protein